MQLKITWIIVISISILDVEAEKTYGEQVQFKSQIDYLGVITLMWTFRKLSINFVNISVNIAKYGMVSQESIANNGEAFKAIDGNTDGDYHRL